MDNLRGLYRASSVGNAGNRGLTTSSPMTPTCRRCSTPSCCPRSSGGTSGWSSSLVTQATARPHSSCRSATAAGAGAQVIEENAAAGGEASMGTPSSPSTTQASHTRASPLTTSCAKRSIRHQARTRRGARSCWRSTTGAFSLLQRERGPVRGPSRRGIRQVDGQAPGIRPSQSWT